MSGVARLMARNEVSRKPFRRHASAHRSASIVSMNSVRHRKATRWERMLTTSTDVPGPCSRACGSTDLSSMTRAE